MNILVLQETDWVNSNTIFHHHIFELLSKKGWSIRVIDYINTKNNIFDLKSRVFQNVSRIYKGAKICLIRPGKINLPFFDRCTSIITQSLEILKAIREKRPDIMVIYSISTGIPALFFAKIHGVPTIFHLIDNKPAYFSNTMARIVVSFLENIVLKNVDKIIVNSTGLKKLQIKKGIPKEKIIFSRTGADNSRYKPNELEAKKLRQKFGIDENKTVLLFMGRLYPFSGLDGLLIEFAKQKNTQVNIVFVIVGGGEMLEKLKKMSRDLGLEKNVIITGKVAYEKIPSYINISDICINSFKENEITRYIVPGKIIEYLASGKCIISTKLQSLQKQLPEGSGIFYVNGYAELIEKANFLMKNKALKREQEKKAIKFSEKFEIKKVTEDFKAILESTIARAKKSD